MSQTTGTSVIDNAGTQVNPKPGSAGLDTQLPGTATTVSEAAGAEGGINAGNLIEPDIDDELFRFNSDDTPLMNLMLKAKKVKVNSPEVDHYMLDEPRYMVEVSTAVEAGSANRFALPLNATDQNVVRPYTTLALKGVNGYAADGSTSTAGVDMMLFVTGEDASGNPMVMAVNGPKATANSEYCTTPAIPAGTKCIILSNALYETQKEVDPDLIIPQASRVYLQKRGMNQIVSDYFDSQKKRIPFSQAIIAEQAIANFKTRGNRTLWIGKKGKFRVQTGKVGMQYVYTTEGVRWQFKRELQHSGTWTFEKLIALAKMFFTGEDVPKTALLLAGKNLLEELQCIDFSKHTEVQVSVKTNPIGWEVTNIHTVFGDIEIKREPTLDRLGYSNSGALLGEDRLVHYQYSAEHSFNDQIEGEEAKRTGILVWDALALKGSCHIWIDGENESATTGTTTIVWYNEATAPTSPVDGQVYYFLQDCTLSSSVTAQSGSAWKYTTADGWEEYVGDVYANS